MGPSRRSCFRSGGLLPALAAALVAASGAGAAPSSSLYTVSFVETSARATGDVVRVGDALFVGVGGFGAGAQTLVRIDGGGETALAAGFNSLAGFAWDAINGRLVVGDNGGELSGATTGDTLYTISDPFGSPGSPAAAGSLEALASGSVPGLADIVLDPGDATGDRLLVSDASGPPGRLLEVLLATSALTVERADLEFAAGLANDATTLFVGEVLTSDFSGRVSTVPLASPGAPLTTLASLPGGLFDLELASDGSLLATSGGSLVRIDPGDGSTQELVSGFGFAAGLFEQGGVIYVVDGFAASGEENRVWVFTPIPEPGTGALLALGLAALGWRRRGGRLRQAAALRPTRPPATRAQGSRR